MQIAGRFSRYRRSLRAARRSTKPNVCTFDEGVRKRVLAMIERIVAISATVADVYLIPQVESARWR